MTLSPLLYRKDVPRASLRAAFGEALAALAKKNDRVVALTADLAESVGLLPFAERFPDRFVECGVAEQSMIGTAAGLALAGKIPFAASYAAFSPGRTWDQLRVSVCYANANVKIVGSHAGLTVGPDGATHQAMEDIAMLRALPGIAIVVPCDAAETGKAVAALAEMEGPAYLRLARPSSPLITTEATPFTLGKALLLRAGADVTIAACGPFLYEALLAAKMLEAKKVSADVLHFHTIKPFDEKALLSSVAKTGCVVTVEDHQTTGGLFGAVAESLARRAPAPIEPVGMPNAFGESGEAEELKKKYGLTAEAIAKAATKAMGRT